MGDTETQQLENTLPSGDDYARSGSQVKKLILDGFKSFGRRTELLFGKDFNCVLGPNGSGKCLTGDALVSLEDGNKIPIKNLEHDSRKILCINKKGHIITAEKTKFFKRTVHKLLEIILKSGKKITLTPEHPLLTQHGWEQAQQLQENDYIATMQTHTTNSLLLQTVSWEQISALQTLQKTQEVYDITVPKYHNFIANDIIVHNSNLGDALCFVLGKSSAKSMRAEKSANLIYNGGKSKKPAGQAEVSIVFDNKDHVFPTPEKEVKITRIVKNNGQSKYKINNKTRTRQEILELLSLANINPDGYNIILQGDIVKFCDMSTIDRRKIIEEIAGIGRYEEKKLKALKNLDKVEEKLNQAEIILKEREGYLHDLKKDKDQAVKFKELTDKIKQNKASYLHKNIEEKTTTKKKIEERQQILQEKLTKVNTKIKKFREKILTKKEEIKTIAQEVEEKGETEQVALHKNIEQLRVNIATSQTKIATYQKTIDKIEKQQNEAKKDLAEVKGKITSIEDKRKELHELQLQKQKHIKEVEEKIITFKKKHKIDENTEEIEKSLEKIDTEEEHYQKTIQELREKQQNLLREKDRNEFQLETIDQQIAKVKSIEKKHKDEIETLKKNKQQFKNLILELNTLLNTDAEAAANLGKLRKQLFKGQEVLATLHVKNAAVKEAVQGNIAVKKILESKGRLGEIHGTIGELGKVPSKYSLALEIAAGNKINSIVVQDDKTAARCITYLKTNRFGTATFLPLNKIKGPQVKGTVKDMTRSRGVHGMAIELVSFENRFKEAFKHVFGNTLIIDSIDVARRLGIGTAKMVTLEGDVTELSGAMKGGYLKKRKIGAFKNEDLGKNIAEQEEELHTLQSRITQAEKEKEAREKKIIKLRELKATLEGEIIKVEKSLHLDTNDLQASKDYKKELQETVQKSEQELDKVIDTISEKNRSLAQLKIQKHELRNRINELRNPRLLAEINTFNETRRDLKESLIRITTEIEQIDSQIRKIFGKDKEKTDLILQDMNTEKKEAQQFATELQSHIKEQTKELKIKEKEQLRFQTQFKALFEKRNKLSDDITHEETKVLQLEEQSRKEELSVNTLSIQDTQLQTELHTLQTEFTQYEGVELNLKKSKDELKKEITNFERMKDKIGNVNLRALEIYATVEKEFNNLTEKKNTLVHEKEDVMGMMHEIERNKKDLFMKTLEVIQKEFNTIFSQLTTKGIAELVLEDEEQPFEGGLDINVKLTGTKFLDIRSLSGGEKTLTALAFIFSIQEHSPASFYILDEVDAALDKQNSEKLSKLLRKYSGNAQYIVISHNDAVISEADTLYGVSMNEHGVSNIVSLKV